MTAEGYFNIMVLLPKNNIYYTSIEIVDIMQAYGQHYHQQKLSEVTEKEIVKLIPTIGDGPFSAVIAVEQRKGAKALLEHLKK